MKAIRESDWFGVDPVAVKISPHTQSSRWL